MNVSVAAQTSKSEHDHEHYDGQADLAAGTGTATARHGGKDKAQMHASTTTSSGGRNLAVAVTAFPLSPTSVANYAGQQDDDDNDNGMGDASISTSMSSSMMEKKSFVCDHPIDHQSPQGGDGNDKHNNYLTPERRHQGSQQSQPHPLQLQSQASHTAHNTAQTTAHSRRRRSDGNLYTVADFLRVTTGTGAQDGDGDAAEELLNDLDRDLTLLSKQWCQYQSCHKQKQQQKKHQSNIQATSNNFLNSDMSSPASPKGSRRESDKQTRSVSTGSMTTTSLNPDCAKMEAHAIHFMAALDAAALALEHNLDDYDETHLPRAGDYIHDYIYDYIYDDDDDDDDNDDDDMEDEWNTLHRKERQVGRQMLEAERLMRAHLLLQETSTLQAQANDDAVSESQSQFPDDEEAEEKEGAQVSSSNLQNSVAVSPLRSPDSPGRGHGRDHPHDLCRHSTHTQASPSQSQKSVDRINSSARSLRLQAQDQDTQQQELNFKKMAKKEKNPAEPRHAKKKAPRKSSKNDRN
jgi:hypothetical protein